MTWTIYAQSINEFLPPSLSLLPRTPTLMLFVHVFWHFFLFFWSGQKVANCGVELVNFNFILSFFVLQQFSEMVFFFIFCSGWMSQFFGITFNQVLWKKNEMNIIVYKTKLFRKWDLFFAFIKSMVVCC